MECLRHIYKALRDSSSQSEKDLGLSAAQILVLKNLKTEQGLSINDLAQRTLTHQSSVSVVVKKLEEQGLVRRAASAVDSRKVIVSLTDRGFEKLNTLPRATADLLVETLQDMPPEKTATLATLMSEFLKKANIVDRTEVVTTERR
ncbi:MAG: MarR family transcriptional regulator [Bdellovibrio sp.]|nr:MarR family transcriptional regulator [Bdellovibrio sp.]